MFLTRPRSELFIGITSWNSAYFLGHCLDAAMRTTSDVDVRIVVLDNRSTDASPRLVRERDVELVTMACGQGDALNELLRRANSPYVLLLHADVILLSPHWFALCRSKLTRDVALVSPEDIGCGPLTRPFGKDKPESSFLFFQSQHLPRLRTVRHRRIGPLTIRHRSVDFYGPHITHRLPEQITDIGLTWQPMRVHYSAVRDQPVHPRPSLPGVWTDELRYLVYGLGNFYSLDGIITHYHNWYDRMQKTVASQSPRKATNRNTDFPLDYIKAYSDHFLKDYRSGQLDLPAMEVGPREPKAL